MVKNRFKNGLIKLLRVITFNKNIKRKNFTTKLIYFLFCLARIRKFFEEAKNKLNKQLIFIHFCNSLFNRVETVLYIRINFDLFFLLQIFIIFHGYMKRKYQNALNNL